MKKFKLNPMAIIIIISAVLFSFSTAMAGSNTLVNKIVKKPLKLQFKTDLAVREIFATQCACDDSLGRAGAMFYKDIYVTVGNYPCSVGVVADNVNAMLDVEYFDLMRNRLERKSIPVTLSKNQTKAVKVANGFLLLKKNMGIKATIKITSTNIVDCDMSNNSNRVNSCELRPVY
jgi:hypothetical protein